MITLVDYGLGNIQAIVNIYKSLNIPARIACTAQDLADAQRVILPGVGAFDWAMNRLDKSGMRATLDKLVRDQRKPVLGICVGMHMMARRSEEGERPGLGWVDGEVRRFEKTAQRRHLPHMGWNDVEPQAPGGLFKDLEASARFYFLHSYYFAPAQADALLASTDYHGTFACSVHAGNVYGVQFHPEKSHQWGIQLLKNFAEL